MNTTELRVEACRLTGDTADGCGDAAQRIVDTSHVFTSKGEGSNGLLSVCSVSHKRTRIQLLAMCL